VIAGQSGKDDSPLLIVLKESKPRRVSPREVVRRTACASSRRARAAYRRACGNWHLNLYYFNAAGPGVRGARSTRVPLSLLAKLATPTRSPRRLLRRTLRRARRAGHVRQTLVCPPPAGSTEPRQPYAERFPLRGRCPPVPLFRDSQGWIARPVLVPPQYQYRCATTPDRRWSTIISLYLSH